MKKENRRGAQSRAPLHTPRAFFECLVVEGGSFADLCLYAAVLDVEGGAESEGGRGLVGLDVRGTSADF